MPQSTGPVDEAVAVKRLDGDREIWLELCQAYVEDVPAKVKSLLAAIAAGEAVAGRTLAHTLKSSARTVGAMRLGEMAQQLEADLAQGDLPAAAAKTDAFAREFAAVMDALAKVSA